MTTDNPISFSLGHDSGGSARARREARLRGEAMGALKRRQFQEAKEICLRILNRNPQFADAYYILALIAGETGQIPAAAKTLDMALDLDGENVNYYAQKARFLLPMSRFREASEAALKAHGMGSDDAYQLDTIGCALSQLGFQVQAEEMFAKATALAPENFQYHYNHASSLRFLGEFERAEEAIEKVLRLNPQYYKAHWVLSDLKKQTSQSNHITRLRDVAQDLHGNAEAQSFLHYALGKEYEDMAEYDAAFDHMAQGAAAQRSLLDYDISQDETLINSLISNLDRDFFDRAGPGCDSSEPIFILGLPRSGTTLVERIINSHSDVFAAGELMNFGVEAKWFSGVAGRDMLTPDVIAALADKDLGALGQNYLDSTRAITGGTAHFIDKLPNNFLYIGLIAASLPRARIIHLTRGAMDSCFSMFKQKFALTYHPSYDLEELGRYYLLYRRLMDHWHDMLPGKILDVSYEGLVADQEGVSRKIIEHCGLEWQEGCLNFHQSKGAVTTLSAAQVRRPIYKSSVEKWRHYEKHLTPLRQMLEEGKILEGGKNS